MKVVKLLLLIVLTAGIAACRKINCSDFPVPIKEAYYPYSTGELLKFTNHNNDTLAIKIERDMIHNTPPFRSNCKCACGADASFTTERDGVYLLQIEGSIDWHVGERSDNSCYLQCSFYGDGTADYFQVIKENVENNPDYIIFGDTIFIEKEENKRISSVKIVKDKGIVEFWDKKYNCMWIKTENNE